LGVGRIGSGALLGVGLNSPLLQGVVQGGTWQESTLSNATGSGTLLAVPANHVYVVYALYGSFIADGTSATRTVRVRIENSAARVQMELFLGSITANVTKKWQWGPGTLAVTATPTDLEEQLQMSFPYVMGPATDLVSTGANAVAGDAYRLDVTYFDYLIRFPTGF